MYFLSSESRLIDFSWQPNDEDFLSELQSTAQSMSNKVNLTQIAQIVRKHKLRWNSVMTNDEVIEDENGKNGTKSTTTTNGASVSAQNAIAALHEIRPLTIEMGVTLYRKMRQIALQNRHSAFRNYIIRIQYRYYVLWLSKC